MHCRFDLSPFFPSLFQSHLFLCLLHSNQPLAPSSTCVCQVHCEYCQQLCKTIEIDVWDEYIFCYFIVMNELDVECQTHIHTGHRALVAHAHNTSNKNNAYARFLRSCKEILVFVRLNTHSTRFNIQQKRIHVPDLMIQNQNRLQLFFTSAR